MLDFIGEGLFLRGIGGRRRKPEPFEEGSRLLLEDGSALLLEDGTSAILLEGYK